MSQKAKEIKRLLKQKWPYRTIAQKLNVSVAYVDLVRGKLNLELAESSRPPCEKHGKKNCIECRARRELTQAKIVELARFDRQTHRQDLINES